MSIITKLQMLIVQEMADLEIQAINEDRERSARKAAPTYDSRLNGFTIAEHDRAFLASYLKAMRAEGVKQQTSASSVFEVALTTNPRSEWLL